MSEPIVLRPVLRDFYRRDRYADIAGPASWWASDVAHWLFALCLRRDGRTNAMARASEILGAPYPLNTLRLPIREGAALSLAMWEANCTLDWEEGSLSPAFGVTREDAASALRFVTAELRAGVGPECRQGMADVRKVVRAALEQARAA